MNKEIIEIVKPHDHHKYVVEIKEPAEKGQVQISVKARSDISAKEAGMVALAEYKRLKTEVTK